MSIVKVKEYLSQFGIEDRVLEFDVSSATVDLAAQALGCQAARIAKTISFLLDQRAILIVAAGDTKIDNAKYKAQFGAKAKMLMADQVEPMTGFTVGGVCPFAARQGVDIYLDESLKRFATIFPACGSSRSAIELTIAQLEAYTPFKNWVDVCKLV